MNPRESRRNNTFFRNVIIVNMLTAAGLLAVISASEQRLPLEASGLDTKPVPSLAPISLNSPEKQVFPDQSMNLETLIREQNENGLKKKTGMEIELKLEKEVSIQLFPVQEGYIPVHGTFIDKEGKPPVTFGMALDPKSPFAESLRKDPILPVDTKIKMKVIPSPNTYQIEDLIIPQAK